MYGREREKYYNRNGWVSSGLYDARGKGFKRGIKEKRLRDTKRRGV